MESPNTEDGRRQPGIVSGDLFHVAICGSRGLLRGFAVLTGAQVGSVPVPPLMLAVRALIGAVVLFRFVQQFRQPRDVNRIFPLSAGQPGRDFLKQPTVPVRVLERYK